MPVRDNTETDSGDDRPFGRQSRWRQVVQRRYDPALDGGLTTAIVFAIADAEGVSPDGLTFPPLYDVVDVPGIETALFGSNPDGSARNATGSVEFRYAQYLVKVGSDWWVQVYEPTEPERAD